MQKKIKFHCKSLFLKIAVTFSIRVQVFVACCYHIERDVTGSVECRVGADLERSSSLTFRLTVQVRVDPQADAFQAKDYNTAG